MLENSTLMPFRFANKSLTRAENRYSNIEWDALGKLYSLEKFRHSCFVWEVSIITDHKPLIAIFKKDATTLSQRLQQILLRIHQYRVRIIYKPGQDLLVIDWLYRQNHNENKDEDIKGMRVSINAIQSTTNIPQCMTMHELQETTSQDQHLKCFMEYIIQGWPGSKYQLPKDIRTY